MTDPERMRGYLVYRRLLSAATHIVQPGGGPALKGEFEYDMRCSATDQKV